MLDHFSSQLILFLWFTVMKWNNELVYDLFHLSFIELVVKAHKVHKKHFPSRDMQISTLLSIKTGACSEDCKYCPQSIYYNTGLEKQRLMQTEDIIKKAVIAKKNGAQRFCMGAAWRSLHNKEVPKIAEIIQQVKSLGLETCMTLGMLTEDQALALKQAGLDYYNHNLDTSENYYKKIITTRTYDNRLQTLRYVQKSGIKVCCGGIIGMGEKSADRIDFLVTLANLNPYPESVPINLLVKVSGTPLYDAPSVDIFDFIKIVAIARIIMPKARVRLSAGRDNMSEEAQALCFMAGANSIFYGEKLLTTKNSEMEKDINLLKKLGFICNVV